KGCPDAGQRGKGNLYFRGFSGRGQRIRMVYCRTCKKSFSERKGTPLQDCRLPLGKAVSLLEHIREGCGTRATSRLAKVDKNTVPGYVRLGGGHARTSTTRRWLFPRVGVDATPRRCRESP